MKEVEILEIIQKVFSIYLLLVSSIYSDDTSSPIPILVISNFEALKCEVNSEPSISLPSTQYSSGRSKIFGSLISHLPATLRIVKY